MSPEKRITSPGAETVVGVDGGLNRDSMICHDGMHINCKHDPRTSPASTPGAERHFDRDPCSCPCHGADVEAGDCGPCCALPAGTENGGGR